MPALELSYTHMTSARTSFAMVAGGAALFVVLIGALFVGDAGALLVGDGCSGTSFAMVAPSLPALSARF
eukprot:14409033-Alexandrium_andersonii.AAC.1